MSGKSYFLLLFGVLLILCYFLTLEVPQKTNSNELRVDCSSVDLGKVVKCQEANASFELENVQSKIIHILEPEVSCRCSKVNIVERELHPQKNTKLSVNIDTGNNDGAYVVSILVPYQMNKDETKKYIRLSVKFEVVSPIL
jgi:hypothetical protein